MNKVILIGRLTADPEKRVVPATGMTVANFTLAVNRAYKKDEADFHRIVCFDKTADNVLQYLRKGSQAAIDGELQNNNYEKDGVKHYGYQVVANRVEFLGSSGKTNNSGDDYSSGVEVEHSEDDFPMIDDGDVPF